ncbi:MAG: hypothetical protein VYD19_04820 [Myxococcota bacterium]|nr:hypothetical protein [Myxococcota bacterium]
MHRRKMMKLDLQRTRFHFERFLTRKGGAVYFALLTLFALPYLLLLLAHKLLIFFELLDWPREYALSWNLFLALLTPSRLLEFKDPSPLLMTLLVLNAAIGITFLSTLIAFLTTSTRRLVERFRRGRGPVPEHAHTLILGFDDRVPDILRELAISNESRITLSVVILADHDKLEMDEARPADPKLRRRLRVTTCRGEPWRLSELQRVNVVACRSVILLARCSASASQEAQRSSDIYLLQTIKAVHQLQRGKNQGPIIAEIFDRERRRLISELAPERIVSLPGADFLARLLVQSAASPGLEAVYHELFSFEGSEFYLCPRPEEGIPFQSIVWHYVDGVPIGLKRGDRIELLPDPQSPLQKGDELIVLAHDDMSIQYSKEALYQPLSRPIKTVPSQPKSQRVLILGWHDLAPDLYRECLRTLPPESTIDVVIDSLTLAHECDETLESIRSEVLPICRQDERREGHIQSLPISTIEGLRALSPDNYDTLFLLGLSGHRQPEAENDADTLMLLLLLRRLRDEDQLQLARVGIQVFRSESESLIDEEQDPADFVISNLLFTQLITQLSEEPRLEKIYRQLLIERRVRFDVRPITHYHDHFPAKLSFQELAPIAQARGEICLGFMFWSVCSEKLTPLDNRLSLNPLKDKRFTFEEGDAVVVLCEG